MDLWNVKDLDAPAIATYKSPFFTEITHLRNHFNQAVQYFQNQNLLEKEAALLSRCIYRMKLKFRSDKGLKSMEKLNRALLQFNYLKFYATIDNFSSLLPKDKTGELYLPTRNMLDYILVRLQGVSCLMSRITETALIAADNMGSRICIGHFWKVATIMLGLLSRIWFICKDITKYCCEFYNNIKQLRNNLKNVGSNWLPSDYVLPDSLEEWLNVDLSKIEESSSFKPVKSEIPVLDLSDSSDVEECGEYIEVKDEADEIIKIADDDSGLESDNNIKASNIFELMIQEEDLGEAITKRNIISLSSDSEDDAENESIENSDKFKVKSQVKRECPNTKLEISKKKSNDDSFVRKSVKRKHNSSQASKKKKYNDKIEKEKFCVKQKSTKLAKHDKTKNDSGQGHPPQRLGELKKIKEQDTVQIVDSIVQNGLRDGKLVKKTKKKRQSLLSTKIDNIRSLKDVKKFLMENSFEADGQKFVKVKKRITKMMKQANKRLIPESESLTSVKNFLKMNLN